MVTDSAAGGSAKRQRVDERAVRREAVGADSASADRISALPNELRECILSRLTFKDAIRTGVLARGWRDLWKNQWPSRSSVEVRLSFRDALRRELDALAREPRPRPRLGRFSFVVTDCKLKSSELQFFNDYAAECRVEDLHIEVRRGAEGKLHFPLCSPLLARLSLHGIAVISSTMYYKGARPFRALEVIRLHSVSIAEVGFKNMMALCPSLLTLDLRGCNCDCLFYRPDINSKKRNLVMPPNLRTVTIAYCEGCASLDLVPVPSLRSFCYEGDFVKAPFFLPSDAALGDLYFQFAYSRAKLNTKKLRKSLPKDLSGLNVLTICWKALEVASCLLPNINLPNLRELQLIMLKMEAANLADLYVFFKTFQCPNLERFFVQLPTFSYKPTEGGSIDEVREEPPEDNLDNLLMVKFMNFNWRRSEVQLVSFLLRKASSLRKLLIVSPMVTPPPDLPCVEADLLLLNKALANGKLILSESDDITTQSYHSKVFIRN